MSATSVPVLHIDTGSAMRGGQRQVLLLMRALRELGRAGVLAAPPDSVLASRAADDGFPTIPFHASGDLDLPAAVRLKRYQAIAGAKRPALWHAHSARAQAVACLALRLRLGPAAPKLLVTRRTAFPSRSGPIHRAKYRDARVAHYFAISSAVRDGLGALGVEAERIGVVPSAVEADRFEVSAAAHIGSEAGGEVTAPNPGLRKRLRGELGVPSDCFLVVATGALDESKGYALLVHAAAAAAEQTPGLRCIIAGEGPEMEFLEREISRSGIGDRFQLLGQRSDVPDLLAAGDLFCMPSLAEGLGSAVLEAFAAGIPVVASDAGGLVDLVLPGETGLRFPAGDTYALARCLIEAVTSPEQGILMAVAAHKRVLDDFSAARMAADVERVYASLEGPRLSAGARATTGGLP